MLQLPHANIALISMILGLIACSDSRRTEESSVATKSVHGDQAGESAVAQDVLFLVLGKMSLYDQSPAGEVSLRNHHFVAEIMPKAGRTIVSGTLTSASDRTQVLEFRPEGNAFLAHGARVTDPAELHNLHPDGEYIFSYRTPSGYMQAQSIRLAKRSSIDRMPAAAAVTLSQNSAAAASSAVDHETDLTLAWESMPGNTRAAGSALDDLIFVLAFDCFGNNIAHSGRPYQGGPYLTYKDTQYVIAAASLEPGLKYTAIVEQATADVETFRGVPGIATYATLTFVEFQTSGEAQGKSCPGSDR